MHFFRCILAAAIAMLIAAPACCCAASAPRQEQHACCGAKKENKPSNCDCERTSQRALEKNNAQADEPVWIPLISLLWETSGDLLPATEIAAGDGFFSAATGPPRSRLSLLQRFQI